MPDGKAGGGFARLAAVVKAERAKGLVFFAHARDTLSAVMDAAAMNDRNDPHATDR